MGPVLHHGARIDLGGPKITLTHKDQSDKGSPFQLALGTTSDAAPKKGANVTGGAADHGFNYPVYKGKSVNGFPGYPC